MLEVIVMEEQYCKYCAHYRQHYILSEKKLVRIYAGHCTYAKVKSKKPDSPACVDFKEGMPDEEMFASKEYLSKELLQYLLHLDLLPPIEDRTGFV